MRCLPSVSPRGPRAPDRNSRDIALPESLPPRFSEDDRACCGPSQRIPILAGS
jgi:hypothetical protein